ncbi:MAG: phenylalanine--tRNA ligase subunit beta [Alphaproteobacteria bacterium]|nr:phenylalanine--tRNA ligase subunit beta [Alphaproteobacteria bacterium]
MKFTLGWLKEHLDTNASIDTIAKTLTNVGLELEGIEDPSKVYAPFHTAYVVSAEKHPDADRLKVCIVDTGTEKVQVVCGAPNAKTGMKAVFAPEGSYVPGTDMVLKKGVIRGVESCGMLVSEREMGLSDDHEGIIELPVDTPVGVPFAEIMGLNDPVFDISVTPNRADCAGIYGIARDLAAAGLGKLKELDIEPVKGRFESPIGVDVKTETNPLFLGRYIRGVKNGPSPDWLQRRLKAVGLRPISALVDITNYVSLGHARPLHVYDADLVKGNIYSRLSKEGEHFEALNDKEYTLQDGHTVICDGSGVLGLGGVVGGTSTGVTGTTVNVFVESAYFTPTAIARTGRALQIDSDARYRFERGIDPEFTYTGMELATKLILDLCGGEPSEVVEAGALPKWRRVIEYSPDYCLKLGGVMVGPKEQHEILRALGFLVTGYEEEVWAIEPPPWRGDVEDKADIVEEILRIHGFDNLPAVPVRNEHSTTQVAETKSGARARLARTALATRGLEECITWAFMQTSVAQLFGANDNKRNEALTLLNPINAELDLMRPTPLPNLIAAAGRNADRGYPNAGLFEIGPGFISPRNDGQLLIAAGVRAGNIGERHWDGPQASRPVDVFDAKGDCLAALEACGAPVASLQIGRDADGWYHPGRSATLKLGRNVLAQFGEIHPAVLEEMDVDGPVAAFEIYLDNIPDARAKGTHKPSLELHPLQPVSRDFAFIVDRNVEAETLIRAARACDKRLIADAQVFDIYTGKGIEEGRKSVALTVILQPKDKSLTETELESISAKITDAVAAKTGGVLRG